MIDDNDLHCLKTRKNTFQEFHSYFEERIQEDNTSIYEESLM